MDTDSLKKLNESAVEVFGTMYYTPIELLPEIPPEDRWNLEENYAETSISYDGDQVGHMKFFFPKTLAVNIAGGFLGADESSLQEEQIVDTMREATNMIIGNFLGKIDPAGLCKLGIPAAGIISDFSPKECPAGRVVAFMSDFGYLWMEFAG
nr:chemotaxis protein CheX [Desulfobulbaceae bacterium]